MNDLSPIIPNGNGAGIAPLDINEHLSRSITVSTNLETNIVVTTRDKISNSLHEMLPKVVRRNAWLAPASLLLTLITTLVTADFSKDLFGVSPDIWQAAFMLGAGGTLIWLVVAMVNLVFRSAGHAAVLEAIAKTHQQGPRETLVGVVNDVAE